jgi:hypothetical protein
MCFAGAPFAPIKLGLHYHLLLGSHVLAVAYSLACLDLDLLPLALARAVNLDTGHFFEPKIRQATTVSVQDCLCSSELCDTRNMYREVRTPYILSNNP